jgi:hypothetical protein
MRIIIAYVLVLLLAACHFRTDQKALSGIRKLPGFRIISIDSSWCINTKNIPNGLSTVFLYFDPDCKHCQKLTKNILQHVNQLKDINLYWVTNGDQGELKHFCKYYHFDTLKNIVIGEDYEYSFYGAYLPSTVPFIAIYNCRRSLVKIYKGEVNVNSIITSTHD